MAHIYYGNRPNFERNMDVVEAVAQLSDEYWALFEFDVPGCNIDCLILKPATENTPPSQPSPFILTEIKHVAGELKGLENEPWTITRSGIEQPYNAGKANVDNPWQQTLLALNIFRDWFRDNQTVFLSSVRRFDDDAIKIWPTLLIVRTDGEGRHRLPTSPASRFGTFSFSTSQWIRNISNWEPYVGVQLTKADVEGLIQTLRLNKWNIPIATPSSTEIDTDLSSLPESLNWVKGLVEWALNVEQRIEALEEKHPGK